jgi:hypothetical protein
MILCPEYIEIASKAIPTINLLILVWLIIRVAKSAEQLDQLRNNRRRDIEESVSVFLERLSVLEIAGQKQDEKIERERDRQQELRRLRKAAKEVKNSSQEK